MDSERVKQELLKNEKVKAEGLRQGMTDLLELHTCEELLHLCKALSLPSGSEPRSAGRLEESSPKADIIAYIFQQAIDPNSSGYTAVLEAVWDGILIEYLRRAGKNLARCRNNLRGVVLKHWTRHALATAKASSSPIAGYSRTWRRLEPSCEVDIGVNACIQDICRAEKDMKEIERQVRLRADYPSITAFIERINRLRTVEERTRELLLSHLQELLDGRDQCQQRAESAESEAKRSKEEWTSMRDQLVAKEAMLKYRSDLEWDRIIDRVYAGVEQSSLQISLDKQAELRALELRRHNQVEEYLLQRKAELEKRVAELEISQLEMKAALKAATEKLAKEEKRRIDTRIKFDSFREKTAKFIHSNLSASALRECSETVTIDLLLHTSAERVNLEQQLAYQTAAAERATEQRETLEMANNDPQDLARNSRPSSKKSQRSVKKKPASAKKQKSKRGKTRGKTKLRGSKTAKDLSLNDSIQSLDTVADEAPNGARRSTARPRRSKSVKTRTSRSFKSQSLLLLAGDEDK